MNTGFTSYSQQSLEKGRRFLVRLFVILVAHRRLNSAAFVRPLAAMSTYLLCLFGSGGICGARTAHGHLRVRVSAWWPCGWREPNASLAPSACDAGGAWKSHE